MIPRLLFALALALPALSCSVPSLPPSASTRAVLPVIPLAAPQTPEQRRVSEARGRRFVIATEGRTASRAAQAAFAKGGNIIDAAVAASFAISVERPQSTGLGGGGFLLFAQAKTGKVFAVDFRERAPIKSTERMYLGPSGEIADHLSTDGILSVAVPGLVAGLYEIHRRFGKLPMPVLAGPAIELAERGLTVYPHLARALEKRRDELARNPASRAIYLKADGAPYKEGELLVQKDLGRSLRKIIEKGPDVFYRGEIARAIARESERLGGRISEEDLAGYRVKWRDPVRGRYHGYEIVSMPPPSSGGAHVIEILQILERDPLPEYGALSAEAIHLEASAMQLAFADRARFMGDPDFVHIPLAGLLSPAYAEAERRRINPFRETPSSQVQAGSPPVEESTDTTHFSIMDDEGNVVTSTQTINGLMGSGVVVPGTGILLNNEMDDFTAKPGASNMFGAIGGKANAIAPGKTPLSSMAPTIVFRNGAPVLAIGAPGGTRIITCVAQAALNYLGFRMPLYESIAAIRFHHQWKPDELDIDMPGPGIAVTQMLQRMGYHLKTGPDAVPCRVMAAAREGDQLHGVADPRDIGSSIAE